jgi:hypothetical protein
MSDPDPTPAFENRIAELATGFAIGDLDEAELRELYDLLRDEQGNGPRAAQVAWQTLGMVTDIRSQVSTSFQDTVVLRLQQASLSGRFTNALFKRLGMRSGTLQPVETPQQQKTPLRIALWLVVALVVGALLAGGIGLLWSAGHGAHAMVTALHGSATIAGQSLTPGADVDHRSLVVKPGGQLTLLWSDGSSAVLAGDDGNEAVATVRGDGLVLLRGQAWITGRRGFALVLPGERLYRVDLDGTRVAAQALSQHGFAGVRHGAVRDERLGTVLGDNMGSGPGGAFRWQWEWDLARGALAGGRTPPPDWRLSGDIAWHDLSDQLRMVFTGGEGPVGERGLELRVIPGLVVVLDQGQEVQRLTLPGSPLLGMRLTLRQSDGRTLTVAVGELSLTVPLGAPLGGYRLYTEGGTMVKVDSFHPLPGPHPPLAVPGW